MNTSFSNDALVRLMLKLRSVPFLPLDVTVPLKELRREYSLILEKGYKLSNYQTKYKLVRNYYSKSWSGICLISSDGGLYTDLSEGDIQSTLSEFAHTELSEHCPSHYDLISRLNNDAPNTRARIMTIAPKRSLLWHSHVLEHRQPEYILTVQIPIHVPESFLYCVLDRNDFRWYKRFSHHTNFDSIHSSNLKPGAAYVFNSFHFHNVYNSDQLKTRVTLMVYLDLRNDATRDMVQRSLNKLDTSTIDLVAGKTSYGKSLSIR